MASLNAGRRTTWSPGENTGFPVKAGATIFPGSLVALDAGYAVPGRAANSLIAIGCAQQVITEPMTGLSTVVVKRGNFQFANAAADLVTQANVGTDCYILDDQTVSKTNQAGTLSRAGKVVAVDTLGVWVRIGLGD